MLWRKKAKFFAAIHSHTHTHMIYETSGDLHHFIKIDQSFDFSHSLKSHVDSSHILNSAGNKMVSHKFFILLTIVVTIQFARARIDVSVDMNPLELQSLGAIMVETYLRHNLIQRLPTPANAILNFILKIPGAIYNFFNLTASLICAGIITPILHENYFHSNTVKSEPEAVASVLTKKCAHDFGCERNICWRTCHSATKKNAWCYTSPDIKHHKYQQCFYAHQCSPCWECLGPCND